MAEHLKDEHFFYPEHLAPDDVVARIQAVLSKATANRDVLLDPALGLANFIFRACWKAGVNPLVPLLAMQRERSLFTLQAPVDGSSWKYACGVVGQDKPGTKNSRWNGLAAQILICVELNAWYIGAGPDSNFGYRRGLWPTAGRWQREVHVQILNEKSEPAGVRACESAAEYSQLVFTPHLGLGKPGVDTNTLDVNAKLAAQFCAPFL